MIAESTPGFPDEARTNAQRAFTSRALYVLCFTLAVILFGAVVRITGSGAGCGQHWPTCQGEVLHLPRRLSTLIELSHRLSSGLSALSVFWLTWLAFRHFPRGHGTRKASGVASALMVTEALLGALLVRFALVGDDASLRRALVMPLHLVTTSALTASLALGMWWSLPPLPHACRAARGTQRALRASALLVLLVSAAGAVTALGDTVYPVQHAALSSRLWHDHAPGAHFLERVRVLHPLLAVAGIAGVFAAVSSASAGSRTSVGAAWLARGSLALAALQGAAGTLNIYLSAPGWLQVVHLLIANLLWLALVLLSTEFAQPRTPPTVR